MVPSPAKSPRAGVKFGVLKDKAGCKARALVLGLPLQQGQEVVARCDGSWREAIVVRSPKGKGHVGIVDTETWSEHRVHLVDIAIKATSQRNVSAAAAAAAKAAAARAARAVRASLGAVLDAAAVRVVASPSKQALSESAAPAAAAPLLLQRSRCRPEKAGVDARELRKADEVLHAKVDRGELPGVVSVVFRQGVLAHLDCYGYADLERKTPLRPDSIVKLYSMTKCIVSVAFACCLEDGLLDLDDSLAKFLPAFGEAKVRRENSMECEPLERPITLLHLLTHTSGLGYGPMLGDEADGDGESRFVPLIERAGLSRTAPKDPTALKSLEQWCDELARLPLMFQPGTEWFYSYSHDVLGHVIEVASGLRLDAFLQRRVLGPLGMVDTSFEVPREKWDRVAAMYRRFEVEAPVAAGKAADAGVPKPTAASEAAVDQRAGVAAAGEAEAPAVEAAEAAAVAPAEAAEGQDKPLAYELKRLDGLTVDANEWIAGHASPLLAGGGSVDAMTGGLVSTAADYARFCLMLLRKGELDGARILKPETVELLTTNQLPRATGRDDVWAFGTPGVGFGLLGSVSVAHPDLDTALRPGEYGWGGMAGTAWTNDPKEDFFLLSFSLTAFDLTTEEELRAGVRSAIEKFDQRRERAELRRMERLEREQRRLEAREATAGAVASPARAAAEELTPQCKRGPSEESLERASGSEPQRRRLLGKQTPSPCRAARSPAPPTPAPVAVAA